MSMRICLKHENTVPEWKYLESHKHWEQWITVLPSLAWNATIFIKQIIHSIYKDLKIFLSDDQCPVSIPERLMLFSGQEDDTGRLPWRRSFKVNIYNFLPLSRKEIGCNHGIWGVGCVCVCVGQVACVCVRGCNHGMRWLGASGVEVLIVPFNQSPIRISPTSMKYIARCTVTSPPLYRHQYTQ